MRRDEIQKGTLLVGGAFRARIDDSYSDDVIVKSQAAAKPPPGLDEIRLRIDAAARKIAELKRTIRK